MGLQKYLHVMKPKYSFVQVKRMQTIRTIPNFLQKCMRTGCEGGTRGCRCLNTEAKVFPWRVGNDLLERPM